MIIKEEIYLYMYIEMDFDQVDCNKWVAHNN